MSALPLFAEPTFVARPLRQHQIDAMTMLKTSILAGNRRIVVQMPTGAGKTRLAAEIVNGALNKGKRVAFTVPALSLIDQTVEAFRMEGINAIGVIQANHELTNYEQPVQVCSLQTLGRRGVPDADVVIVDECHLRFEVLPKWMRTFPQVTYVGLSATPWARGMADDWQDLVIPVSMQSLIDAGYLSPFRVYAPTHPDLSGVKTMAGDYHEGQLAEVMGQAHLVADVVETWLKLANWQPTLVFAVNRAHAANLQEQFGRAGVPMGYCDAHTDGISRKALFGKMSRGEIAGIVNVGTLTTGVDADVRCVVLARPTKSEMLFVQMVGRALRTAPGKAEALILDHADNHARLGFVTDIYHPALLSGKDKRQATRKEKGEAMPKECPSCGVLKAPKVRECPKCGFTPSRQSEIETEEGELVEVTRGKKAARNATIAEKQAFYSGLLFIARERKRSEGWAAHTYRKRFSVWPNPLDKVASPPSDDVRSYVKALDIRFAKARGAAR